MKKKRKDAKNQIGLLNISLSIGDKLYKGDILYGEIISQSSNLYLIKRISEEEMPIPCRKELLIEKILDGTFLIKEVKFE